MLNLRNKLYDVAFSLIYFITGIIAFCYEIIRHPISNISTWAVVGLAYIININVELSLNAEKMFSLSLVYWHIDI